MAAVIFTLLSNKLSEKDIFKSARKHGLSTQPAEKKVFSTNKKAIDDWVTKFSPDDIQFSYNELKLIPKCINNELIPHALNPSATRNWFTSVEIATIYKIPRPTPSTKVVVAVLSFGGGLYGNLASNGILTGGDVQQYWASLGITTQPTVIVVPINGATNNVSDFGSTAENTLDIETIGGCCPSSNLTIILYISPNSLNDIYNVFNYIIYTPVIVSGQTYIPSIISCSWGIPEVYMPVSLLGRINNLLSTATTKGINICTATGDYGSNNGVGGTGSYADFPSSCPNVTAVGGTRLVCPNYVYDSSTVETAWSSGGGAVSEYFSKPAYQSALTGGKRSVPDIALLADPSTGMQFLINGSTVVYGGTSVAAPIFAGFLAATNTTRFVNSYLYRSSGSFNDIKSGSNGAFAAVLGYDLCTGLGSIKGDLVALVVNPAFANILASGVSFDKTTISIIASQPSLITASVLPITTTNKGLTWSSSNTSVATVLGGLVTGVAAGTAIITATTVDGSNKSRTSIVTVAPRISVTSVSMVPTSATLNKLSTLQLAATVLPANAFNKAVTWLSNNRNVTVSSTGLVTAINAGNSVVTVRTADGSRTASCSVIIPVVKVTSIIVNKSTLSLPVNGMSTVIATVLQPDATNTAVTWSASSPQIVTVNSSGLIKARRRGTATITVTSNSDKAIKATIVVTVT